MTAHEPTATSGRAGIATVACRLWMCGLFWAVALGAYDVVVHAPRLRWFEAIEIISLYALFGGAAALVTLPFGALLLAAVKPWLGIGRGAAALLWLGLATAVLLAFEQRALSRIAALVAFALASLVAMRASALRSFETKRRWHVRRGLLCALAVAFAVTPAIGRKLAAPGTGAPAPAREGRPDVVLIVLDTQRADHLGCYGDPRGLTPSFDAFAREGALYSDCFSSAPWTVPSHASLFTSLQPPTHGCSFEHHRWLDSHFTTLAEALAARDYQTAAFAANEYLFESNLLQGFAVHEPLGARCAALALRPLFELLGWPARYCDHGAADAIERIDDFLARKRDGDRPLFLFVNLLETHWRDLPPLSQRLAQTRPQPGALAATNVSRQFYGPLVMAGKPIDGPLVESIRALYAGAVQYQDEKLGELLALLRRRLDLDHAVVAITADHGENLGEGGRFDHVFAVNDALLHVPLAIRYPPAFPAGTRVPGLCELVDLPVTLFALTNREGNGAFAEGLAGRTLEPGRFAPREVVLGFGDPYLGHLEAMAGWSGFNRDVLPFAAVQRCIRDGRRKLVRSSVRGDELFDVADRDELHEIGASDPAARDKLRARLDAELSALTPYVGPPQRPPEDPDPPPFDDEGLQQLGYVGRRK